MDLSKLGIDWTKDHQAYKDISQVIEHIVTARMMDPSSLFNEMSPYDLLSTIISSVLFHFFMKICDSETFAARKTIAEDIFTEIGDLFFDKIEKFELVKDDSTSKH